MSLIEQVTQTITHALTSDLAEFIADHFGLDSNEVTNVIRDYLGHVSTPVTPVKVPNKVRESPPTKPATSGVKTCGFRITRGAQEGKLCGTAIRGNSDYCSKHKNRKGVKAESTKKDIIQDPKTKYWILAGTKYVVKSPHDNTVTGKIVGTKIVGLNKKDKITIATLKSSSINEQTTDDESNED